MPAPILATKLYIPSLRPKIVLRPRLVARLDEGFSSGCKLAIVSAPAGFGKTTLVSEWVAACERQRETLAGKSAVRSAAWLSLDEGDHDLNRFLTYLIASLQTLTPETDRESFGAGALAVLQSTQPPPIETVLTTLLNDIIPLAGSFILVLDDYHVIESKTIDQALAFLVEHSPPQMHVVIITREDPHLPLARLRTRGQLTELRAADLRFTSTEAAEFLNRIMGLNLKDADIAALESRTEGWIAGLQLAALSMRGMQDTTSFIQAFTGSHHFVLDYLLEEVLHQQPEGVQAFLLQTSILSRLCGPLCDAVVGDVTVSGQDGQQVVGQQILEYLERANLFVVPLDNERRWYRYHHLFRDILRQRLVEKLSSAEIAAHHLRASVWHEKNGDEAEAFQHAFASGDTHRAAGLAEVAHQGMQNRFQTAAWLGWVKKLPEAAVRMRPVLLTQMAQSFMDAGEPEASEACLRDVERCLDGPSGGMVLVDETQLKTLPAVIAMTRAYNAQVQGDLSTTAKYAELALQLTPEEDFFRRAQATITLEVTHWARGDLELARSALGDWMNSLQKGGNFVFFVASAFAMADLLVGLGRLREAVATYRESLRIAGDHGKDAQRITAHHYLGLALLHHEMGEDAAATEYLQKAREMGEQTTLVDWAYRWHVAQARIEESKGDLETALMLLDIAGRAYVKTPIPDTRPIEALKANVYLKQGRLDKALDWVSKRGLSAEDETSYLNEYEHLVLARALVVEYLSQRRKELALQATGLLERLLKAAEAQKRTGIVIEILVAQALAYQAQGALPLALASLERALNLAEPEGYVRIFLDEGEPVRLLIEKVSRERVDLLRDYVDKLLIAFKELAVETKSAHPGRVMASIHPKPEMIEPLSDRELEVLKLLRTDLSGPEIASQLVISPNTFRTHTRNIFSKLGVNNRRAAVRQAEELELF